MRAGAPVADSEEQGASPYLNLERPDDDALASIENASVRYRIAVGPIAGRKTLHLLVPGLTAPQGESAKLLTAARDGFSLNASVACGAEERKKLERLCRTISRPALSEKRLSFTLSGNVRYELETSYRNGTMPVILEPLDFIARPAAPVPKTRVDLTRLHGVFAANSGTGRE